MASKKHGLGKGLGALGLRQESIAAPKDGVQEARIADIRANRYQPRVDFDEAALEELTDSIKAYGVLQPLIVRKLPTGGYELVAGERRLRAAKQAGLSAVPVLVREYNDKEISEIALIENIQREDLNALEEAKAYARLMKEFRLTQEVISSRVGRSRSHIANFLRLLKLAPRVQEYLANGSLSMGQAKPLLALEDAALQERAADIIQEQELSARQAEALVKRLQTGTAEKDKQEKQGLSENIYLKDAVESLKEIFGTQVAIRPGKKKSKLEIEFYSEEDLERILSIVKGETQRTKAATIEALRRVSTTGNFTV